MVGRFHKSCLVSYLSVQPFQSRYQHLFLLRYELNNHRVATTASALLGPRLLHGEVYSKSNSTWSFTWHNQNNLTNDKISTIFLIAMEPGAVQKRWSEVNVDSQTKATAFGHHTHSLAFRYHD